MVNFATEVVAAPRHDYIGQRQDLRMRHMVAMNCGSCTYVSVVINVRSAHRFGCL